MQLGIVGMPMVGKSTIFELLTENTSKGSVPGKSSSAMARVPDYRVDRLSEYYKPKKTTYAQLEVVDIPGLVPGGEKAARVFLDAVRQADALLMVIKVYMRKEKMRESSNWIKKSLDALEERIKNLEYLCQRNRDLSEVDFLILYLGLRDYCSNMFQQMSANYDTERLSKACQELVALADQVSDEIGEAYTAQR
jgi:GTPase involved in cell partitioning and DNA repair